MKLIQSNHDDGEQGYVFHCPGCRGGHLFRTRVGTRNPDAPVWSFDGNLESPTFAPSLLCRHPEYVHDPEKRKAPTFTGQWRTTCHLFLRNGVIEFLPDCAHTLAGTSVPLSDYDDDDAAEGRASGRSA